MAGRPGRGCSDCPVGSLFSEKPPACIFGRGTIGFLCSTSNAFPLRHTLSLRKPLVFFDIEATGIHLVQDRIVEISFAKALPDGSVSVRTERLHPGMPIPLESSRRRGGRGAFIGSPCGAAIRPPQLFGWLEPRRGIAEPLPRPVFGVIALAVGEQATPEPGADAALEPER